MTEGIAIGISEEAYRAAEGVNQTSLKLMAISAAHYRSKIDEKPKPPTDAQRIGTVTHQVILQDKHDYVVRPAGLKFSTVEGKAWKKAQTKTIIDLEEERDIEGMRASVMAHPVARAILERPGQNEVASFRRDPETGLMLKGRADRVCMDDQQRTVIPDLKTTQHGCAGKEAFSKEIYNWGYAIQAHHYLTLFGASSFVFIVVEKESPYACAVYALEPDAIAHGARLWREYLNRVKECTDSGIWPAYSTTMEWIGLPEWAKRKEL